MRNYLFVIFFTSLLIIAPLCKQQPVPQQQFSVQLTEEEKSGGVLTPEILWKFSRLGSFALSPDGKSVVYSMTQYDLNTEARTTNLYKISSTGGPPIQLTTDGGSAPQWFDNGKKIAFISKGKLTVMNADRSRQQTVQGLDNFEIFSISPSGDRIYFTRRVKLDTTANEKYNLPKANVRIIDDLMYRHWSYWSDYSYSHIFTASFDGKKIADEKDIMQDQHFESPLSPYFDETEISWSPDGRYIAYTTKRLKGKEDALSTNSDIYLYDITTGKEVNISDGIMGYDKYPAFSPDGSMIAWQSMERDGYESDLERLFVYNIKDGTKTWLTKGWDFDVENISWADNNTIYFTCPYLGTTQIFKTDLQSKVVTKVTEGIHDLGPVSQHGGTMIAQVMSMSLAPEIALVDINSGEVKKITNLNGYLYDNIKMGKVEERYIKTKDNKDLQMWVIYPPDFNPSKKYPLLLYCKGGPQGPLGQSWSYRWNYQLISAKGYIVVAPNRRGNSGFGQAWKEQISGDYGGKNIQDYLDATDAMAKEPFVDANRMGAVGASYGGFSVFYLAGMHQKRFKAFVAHCGLFDFESWYGSTEELWFPNKDLGGPYWENHSSYKFSPHLMVKDWDTPILIITSENDFRVPYTQSLEAFTAAQLRGVPSRLLFFGDESHWISKPQNSVIWYKEFFSWLDTYLK